MMWPGGEEKRALRQRDRLVGMGIGKGSHKFAARERFWFGFGGQVEKCALAVAFDRVACTAGDCSLLRPRRPASGDGSIVRES